MLPSVVSKWPLEGIVEHLARMTLGEDLLDDLHQDGLRGTALLDDEGVGALHLGGAAIEQSAFVLGKK